MINKNLINNSINSISSTYINKKNVSELLFYLLLEVLDYLATK